MSVPYYSASPSGPEHEGQSAAEAMNYECLRGFVGKDCIVSADHYPYEGRVEKVGTKWLLMTTTIKKETMQVCINLKRVTSIRTKLS